MCVPYGCRKEFDGSEVDFWVEADSKELQNQRIMDMDEVERERYWRNRKVRLSKEFRELRRYEGCTKMCKVEKELKTHMRGCERYNRHSGYSDGERNMGEYKRVRGNDERPVFIYYRFTV